MLISKLFLLICLNLISFTYQNHYQNVDTESIPIALFTDQNSEAISIVFDTAIEVAEESLGIKLTAIKEEVVYGDSFGAYEKLNAMLKYGVAGVFGPTSRETAEHLATFCDAKDIPYIQSGVINHSEGFNLYPDAKDLSFALFSIISEYEWNKFVFLYESAEYLNILTYLLDFHGSKSPFISVYRYDINMDGDYKPMLRKIRKSNDNQIVVVGSSETMLELFKQAQQVGLINKTYKFIIANLDFQSLDLSEYKFGEANITSFSMFSVNQPEVQYLLSKLNSSYDEMLNGPCPITLEMALLYDAVQLFAEASTYLSLRSASVNCSRTSDCVLNDGTSFKNYLRSITVNKRTITKDIYFLENVRKGYELNVLELQPSGIVEVGTWNEERNFTSQRLPPSNLDNKGFTVSLANKTFRILLSLTNPYASIVETHKHLEGNDQYEGFCVDLIKALAEILGFNYTLLDGGTDYGEFNMTTNITTGMLKQILDGAADLIVTDLTITAERQKLMDFTIPFMNLGVAILHLEPVVAPPSLFSFMTPLSTDVWLYMALSFILVSLSFFILGRLSPAEWDNPYPCVEDPTELETPFTLGNSLWFTTGVLLQQGSEIGPKALSTRAVASIWMFFTLIMVNSYTANLAACLTITIPTSVINNVEDLSMHKGGLVFGSKNAGATRKFFQNSGEEIYKRMNKFMEDHPEYLTNKNEDGVLMVKNRKNYAFLMESTTIEYNTVRDCKLKKIGDALDEKGYGIASRKNWPYREMFNDALLQLQEQNMLEKLKNKWWNEVGAVICSDKNEQSDGSKLDMENLGGVYYVLVVGSVLALFYGLINWILFVIGNARHYKEPIKTAFKMETKLLMDINTNTREL